MLHILFKFSLVALFVILCGCNTMPKPTGDGHQDLTYQFAHLKYLSNHGLIDPEAIGVIGTVFNNPGKTNVDGVNEYRRWWCTKLTQREMSDAVNRISTKHCQNMQGKWDGHWCRSVNDSPLFYVDAGNLSLFKDPDTHRLPFCTSGIAFSVVASTSEGSNLEAWQTRASKTYGFKTLQGQLEQKNADEAQRSKILQKKQSENIYNGMQIEARGIGSRVCKKTTEFDMFTGFVEQFDKDRMKVRVTEKLISNYRDNRFSPTTIWDRTENWHPCNTKDEEELMGH